MFKDYLQDISEQEYRDSDRISYSFLKELDESGPSIIVDGIPEIKSQFLTLGSIVDKLLTEDFYDPEDDYFVSNIDIDLSGGTNHSKILAYINKNKISDISDQNLELICKEVGIKRNPKFNDGNFQTQLSIILKQNNGEKIVSRSELDLAFLMADTIKTHPHTKWIFDYKDMDNVEFIPQAKIFFKLNGVEVKAMLDFVIVLHDEKRVIPIDLKTGSFFDFIRNFFKYKYYLQGGMYTSSIQSILQKNKEFDGYSVDSFMFAYISREKPLFPVIYKMSEKSIVDSVIGYINNGRIVKGVLDIINDYKWYNENSEYNYKREFVENNGIVDIKL